MTDGMKTAIEIVRIKRPKYQADLINKLVSRFADDERILTCWVRGSFASGKADKYSDIDMAIAVDDQQFHGGFVSARTMAHEAGEVIVHWDSPKDINGSGFTAFYSDLNFLDVKVYRCSRAPFIGSNSPTLVLFDRADITHNICNASDVEDHMGPPAKEQVWWKMIYLWTCAYTAVKHLKRGEFWYASGMIAAVRGTLAQILWLWEHPAELTDMSFIVWGVVHRDMRPEILDELEKSVPDAEKAELEDSLGRLLNMFLKYGKQIACDLNAEYPEKLVDMVYKYYQSECG